MPADLNIPRHPDTPIGETILARFVEAVEAGETPRRELLELISAMFQAILSGEPAAKSLRLERRRGRSTADWKHAELAMYVEMLRKFGKYSYNEAIDRVAKHEGKSRKTVQRRHSQFKEFARALIAYNRRQRPGNALLDTDFSTWLDKNENQFLGT